VQKQLFITVFLWFAAASAFAQGGKAEPRRIQFADGASSIRLTGRLSTAQEMEYVFAAKKGQTVTLRMVNTSLFDYRVFNQEFDFETEYDSSPSNTFEIPETGDYLLFVRKKMTRPRTATFSLLLTIK
jgi:hypothetical protein